MTTAAIIFPIILPLLIIFIAVVFLCFYCHLKKKREAYDITIQMQMHPISWSEDPPALDPHCDRLPPRYSTIEHPPPYSLFDPRLTNVWPGGMPPAYEMYPITLPLALHYWTPSVHPAHPNQPSSLCNNSNINSHRERRVSIS